MANLQLVLAGLSLRARVEKVDGQNLCAACQHCLFLSRTLGCAGEVAMAGCGLCKMPILAFEQVVCPAVHSARHSLCRGTGRTILPVFDLCRMRCGG